MTSSEVCHSGPRSSDHTILSHTHNCSEVVPLERVLKPARARLAEWQLPFVPIALLTVDSNAALSNMGWKFSSVTCLYVNLESESRGSAFVRVEAGFIACQTTQLHTYVLQQ